MTRAADARGVLECRGARVEATPARPGAWWRKTRALVGFEAGEAEAATATATETDPAVRALAARGALRRLRPVAPPAVTRASVFLNHARSRDAPVRPLRSAPSAPLVSPRACWRATCSSHPSFPPATSASSRTRFACWKRRRRARRFCSPRTGSICSPTAHSRGPLVTRGARTRRLNSRIESTRRRIERLPNGPPRGARVNVRRASGAAARSRGGRAGGAKVLGKSFYDASVNEPPGGQRAPHRSRLANHRSVLAGGSRRAGSDDGSDHRPAADADDDARSLSSLASARRGRLRNAPTMEEIRAREIRRPREIRLPLRCSQVFPGCPRRSRGGALRGRAPREAGDATWSDERRSDESARPSGGARGEGEAFRRRKRNARRDCRRGNAAVDQVGRANPHRFRTRARVSGRFGARPAV